MSAELDSAARATALRISAEIIESHGIEAIDWKYTPNEWARVLRREADKHDGLQRAEQVGRAILTDWYRSTGIRREITPAQVVAMGELAIGVVEAIR